MIAIVAAAAIATPVPITWVREALPYVSYLSASLGVNAGAGSEQIAWRPEFGGVDPCIVRSGGVSVLRAERMDAQDRALVAAFAGKTKASAEVATAAGAAKWKACWLESAEALSGDYTVSEGVYPAPGETSWSIAWAYASDVQYRSTRAEIDFAEVTINSDGSMRLRQQIHGLDPKTKARSTWPSKGCPTTLPARRLVTAGYRIRGDLLTFTLDGRDTCAVTIPAGLNVPQHLIATNLVGGLAKPSTPTTPTTTMVVGRPVVTRP